MILEEGPRSSGSRREVRSWRPPRVSTGRSLVDGSPWKVVKETPHSSEGHRPIILGRLELRGFFRFFEGEGKNGPLEDRPRFQNVRSVQNSDF